MAFYFLVVASGGVRLPGWAGAPGPGMEGDRLDHADMSHFHLLH